MKEDKIMRILAIYVSSVFQSFENFLRTEIDLVGDDVRALFNILQPEYELFTNSVDIEFDDITLKTKLVVRSGNIAIRFDGKSIFSTILGFTLDWGFEHYSEYFSQKLINLSSTKNILSKRDVIDGRLVNGL